MQEPEITDVEFTEIKKEPAAASFNPAVFLTEALISNGLIDAAKSWSIGIDPRAETAESEKDRIFFANRALRLFLAEIEGRDNITPRMLLADGIDSIKWMALIEQGVIPWLLNQFDSKGKRVVPEDHKEDFTSNTGESDIASKINAEGDKPVVLGMDMGNGPDQSAVEQWDPTAEMVTRRDEIIAQGDGGCCGECDQSKCQGDSGDE